LNETSQKKLSQAEETFDRVMRQLTIVQQEHGEVEIDTQEWEEKYKEAMVSLEAAKSSVNESRMFLKTVAQMIKQGKINLEDSKMYECERNCGYRGRYQAVCAHEAICSAPVGKTIQEYECENNCGFRGNYESVSAHEIVCPLRARVGIGASPNSEDEHENADVMI
jgi:hypothetical protein